MTAAAIRAAIRQLPDTHDNMKAMVDAVAAMVAASSADTSEVSELLDRASDVMEDVYVPSREERAEREAA